MFFALALVTAKLEKSKNENEDLKQRSEEVMAENKLMKQEKENAERRLANTMKPHDSQKIKLTQVVQRIENGVSSLW